MSEVQASDSKKRGVQLLDLPYEILYNIFAHLPKNDHLNYATVCSILSEVVTSIGIRGRVKISMAELQYLADHQSTTLRFDKLTKSTEWIMVTKSSEPEIKRAEAAGSCWDLLPPKVLAPHTLQIYAGEAQDSFVRLLKLVDVSQVRYVSIMQGWDCPHGHRESNVARRKCLETRSLVTACATTLRFLELRQTGEVDLSRENLSAVAFPPLERASFCGMSPVANGFVVSVLANSPRLFDIVYDPWMDGDHAAGLPYMLRACGARLTELSLTFNDRPWPEAIIRESMGMLPKLQKLRIAQEMLPLHLLTALTTLRTLILVNFFDLSAIASALMEDEWLPALEELTLEVSFEEEEEISAFVNEAEGIYDICSDRDVDFDILDYYRPRFFHGM